MSGKTLNLSDGLHAYLLDVSLREPELCRRLRARTDELAERGMLSSPEQVQLLVLLMRATGTRRMIEIGTFTGYTALRAALALPEDARIVCCDTSAQWTAIGREFWEEAGVAHKIDLRLAPALETLDALLGAGRAGSFDFAYIDADKENYGAYYERCLQLLRPGGIIAVDNVLWDGSVIDPDDERESTRAIRDFNHKLREDRRVDLSLVPIGDGLTLVHKPVRK